MVGVIGSTWGTLPDEGGSATLHHWNRQAGEADWKTACGLVAPPEEFFGGLPTVSLRIRRNKDDGPLCPLCLEHYPETPIGKLMEGQLLPL
jgi:hypothetical protein